AAPTGPRSPAGPGHRAPRSLGGGTPLAGGPAALVHWPGDGRSRRPPAWGRLADMRPILRPGTHVLRRGAGELQVGLDPLRALVLPDSAPVRESFRLLGVSADLTEHADPGVVDLLAEHDLLVDERALLPLLASPELPRPATAALARSAGSSLGAVRDARRRCRTEAVAFGPADGPDLRGDLVALLREAGLRELRGRSAPD